MTVQNQVYLRKERKREKAGRQAGREGGRKEGRRNKKKEKGNITYKNRGKKAILAEGILIREDNANRQPQFYGVCIYCRQLHNLPRREVSHGAIVRTQVNSAEASPTP